MKIYNFEKTIGEIDCLIKEHEKRENTFTMSVLQTCREYVEEIKRMKDAEEQGLLLRLKVNVGDKVWVITSPANYSLGEYAEVMLKHPQEKKIQSITITKKGLLYHVKDRTFNEFDFGKTVFLTEEEAESALAEKGAENE